MVDFNPAKGNTQAGNCEVSFYHQSNNIGSQTEENNQDDIEADVRKSIRPPPNAVPDTNGKEKGATNNEPSIIIATTPFLLLSKPTKLQNN
jgi:hypothetical protein